MSVVYSVHESHFMPINIGNFHENQVTNTPKYKGIAGTVQCYIMNPNTMQLVKVRALLDSGSNTSLICTNTAKKANLRGYPTRLTMNVAGDHSVHLTQEDISLCLVSLDKKFMSDPILATTIEKIGDSFPPILTNPKHYLHLKDLTFTEKYPVHGKRPFDILISEPYYSQLMLQDQRVSPDLSVPSAKQTKLGWILRGGDGIIGHTPMVMYGSIDTYMNYDLEMIYKEKVENFDFYQFWSGENVGINQNEPDGKSLTDLEIKADLHQAKTAQYNEVEKCWYVALPWRDSSPEGRILTDNYPRAVAMWHKVVDTVKPEHIDLVNEAYNEMVENGFAEVVPPEQEKVNHPTYIMTSRPVIRPDKTTTKCRIVINASLPDPKEKGRSLNKLLMPGKNMLPQIMELILYSKLKQFIVTVDIRKMFMSVKLSKESDKDMLRFVWAPPGSDKPTLYRFTRLPFGCVSSPYQAIWCLHETAKMWEKKYPKAAKIILEKTYMDDITIMADSTPEAIELTQQILFILDTGGFHGHKISANDPNILKALDSSRVEGSPNISLLGLKLDHASNQFQFDLDDKFKQFDPTAQKITRRDIVSLASQVFDTQGYVSPFIMRFKRLLPMLWHGKTGWDENLLTKSVTNEEGKAIPDPVATEAVELFRQWIIQIPKLKELKFPRWTGGRVNFLAVFGDASKTGMGVAAYIVAQASNGMLNSQLVFSKSSLMPKNLREGAAAEDALTIARAELVALLMAVNVGHYLQNAYKDIVSSSNTFYFTDSLLNLQRIQRGKGHCKQWEERRVEKILANLNKSEVRFCPGLQNPADLPSRGCTLDELTDQFEFWTKGPEFLTKPKSDWPKQPLSDGQTIINEPDLDIDSDLNIYYAQTAALQIAKMKENKSQIYATQSQTDTSQNLAFIDTLMDNCGSWQKAVRVLVRIKRLAQKIREKPQLRAMHTRNPAFVPMSRSEQDWAEQILVRRAQESNFPKEIEILKKGEVNLRKIKNSPLKHLPVFWDNECCLVRLKSRLHLASSLSEDFTNPIILPKGNFAEKKILHLHQSRMHISQRQTFDLLRKRFWVIGNFAYVKTVVQKCKTPRCRYIKFNSPKMSPLPTLRLDNPSPWTNVGVDYLGPLNCKHKCVTESESEKCIHPKVQKIWLVLFTCFHSRAIHVEVVESCSTRDFLDAFRRFIGHCGRPNIFYSDNARYFKAADKHIKLLQENVNFDRIEAERFNGDVPITWKYSTPEAPWTQGVTERMVGILKKQLRIALQKELLTLRAIETLVIELKAIINDRPLGITKQDPDSFSCITPNMLIFGRQLGEFKTPNETTLSTAPYSDLWLERKRVMNHFWSRWLKEYIQELSVDKKWSKHSDINLKEGDVVILKPETLEKNTWRMARITSIQRNQDGVVSTAVVRLPNGIEVERSVRQIALLEPDMDVVEEVDLESPQQSECAGSPDWTLTDLNSGVQPSSVIQSPSQSRPCHNVEVEESEMEPGNVTAMITEPVSQNIANDIQVENDAITCHEHNLRKKRQRKGYYKNLFKYKE